MSVNVSAVWQGRTPDFGGSGSICRYPPFGGSGSVGILRLAAPAPEYRLFVAVPAPGYPPFVAVPALEFGQNENNIFEELTLQALYSLCLC